ncbi:uncharacterized protein LOC124470386 [Hypomesus transpacificus]|uniref:uncharacterized protein LOC124470386 n=1 Tax=Hypomesus transpacificus TaxID=137520 RepID=UPI001F07F94A|nr:uncharacterized protein LOC124470386 [Hypomesus transpacificus]XP_046880195.1 uncharacterized protein LOC124470386 [Hypomesus transpacificus]
MSHRLRRRTHRVAGSNSLWHLDRNHKLLKRRIVIHGGINGFSRLVVFLKASNNNRSDIVMNLFSEAVAQFGVPSRVRSDYGGENNVICLLMDVFRGSTRGSTHNQCIERLWGDVWRGVTKKRRVLRSVVRSAEFIIDRKLPALQDTYHTRCLRKAGKILKDCYHPSFSLYPAAFWTAGRILKDCYHPSFSLYPAAFWTTVSIQGPAGF